MSLMEAELRTSRPLEPMISLRWASMALLEVSNVTSIRPRLILYHLRTVRSMSRPIGSGNVRLLELVPRIMLSATICMGFGLPQTGNIQQNN